MYGSNTLPTHDISCINYHPQVELIHYAGRLDPPSCVSEMRQAADKTGFQGNHFKRRGRDDNDDGLK